MKEPVASLIFSGGWAVFNGPVISVSKIYHGQNSKSNCAGRRTALRLIDKAEVMRLEWCAVRGLFGNMTRMVKTRALWHGKYSCLSRWKLHRRESSSLDSENSVNAVSCRSSKLDIAQPTRTKGAQLYSSPAPKTRTVPRPFQRCVRWCVWLLYREQQRYVIKNTVKNRSIIAFICATGNAQADKHCALLWQLAPRATTSPIANSYFEQLFSKCTAIAPAILITEFHGWWVWADFFFSEYLMLGLRRKLRIYRCPVGSWKFTYD